MTDLTERRRSSAAIQAMKKEHSAQLGMAIAATASLSPTAKAHDVLQCLCGRQRPFRSPTGADMSFREDLAQ